jgi:hypothetical protein
MALCDKSCCNDEARRRIAAEQAAVQAERNAAFEAYLAKREAEAVPIVTLAPDPEGNDVTYAEALERAKTTANRG